jgi:hypothetical protein
MLSALFLGRCFLGLHTLNLGYAFSRMLLDDPLQCILLPEAVDTALLPPEFSRLDRLGRLRPGLSPEKFSFGRQPVVKVMTRNKVTLHVPKIGCLTEHVIALVWADISFRRNLGTASWSKQRICLFSHPCTSRS